MQFGPSQPLLQIQTLTCCTVLSLPALGTNTSSFNTFSMFSTFRYRTFIHPVYINLYRFKIYTKLIISFLSDWLGFFILDWKYNLKIECIPYLSNLSCDWHSYIVWTQCIPLPEITLISLPAQMTMTKPSSIISMSTAHNRTQPYTTKVNLLIN